MNKLKCRFCTYTVLRYKRNKNGKVIHGHNKLFNHVMLHHYDNEYGKVLKQEEEDRKADPATIGEQE